MKVRTYFVLLEHNIKILAFWKNPANFATLKHEYKFRQFYAKKLDQAPVNNISHVLPKKNYEYKSKHFIVQNIKEQNIITEYMCKNLKAGIKIVIF